MCLVSQCLLPDSFSIGTLRNQTDSSAPGLWLLPHLLVRMGMQVPDTLSSLLKGPAEAAAGLIQVSFKVVTQATP